MRQETHRVHKRRPSCAKATIPFAHSARTTAPQGENESPRKCQYGFPAAIHVHYGESAATRESHSQKPWRKLPLELSNIQPGGTKDPPKSRPEAPMRAQMRPRAFKKLGQGAPDTPKSGQKLLRSGPSAAKMRPRQAWEAPRPLRKRARQVPRRILATIVIGSLFRKGAGTILHDFLRCAHGLRSAFRPIKTVVLLHSEHFDHSGAHACKNVEK